MSHLGDQISALVDGELTGAELDRANAHLAACARCHAEAAALRQLKRQLRALAAASEAWADEDGAGEEGGDALTRRLLAMAGPGGPVPSRRFRREQSRRKRREQRNGRPSTGSVAPAGDRGGRRASRRRGADMPPNAVRRPRARRRRGRYLVLSAVSLLVVGVGAAAFSMGGGTSAPGPQITPQLEMFILEHAMTSGDVPFPDPTQAPTARP